jgi:hypothetical protein
MKNDGVLWHVIFFSQMFLCLRCRQRLVDRTVQEPPVVRKLLLINHQCPQRWPRLSLPWSTRLLTIPAFYVKWQETSSSNMAEGFLPRDHERLHTRTSLKPVPHFSSKPKIPSEPTNGCGLLSRNLDSSAARKPRSRCSRLNS